MMADIGIILSGLLVWKKTKRGERAKYSQCRQSYCCLDTSLVGNKAASYGHRHKCLCYTSRIEYWLSAK